MTQFPMPDDGLGLIGDIRSFVLDGVEWRAFEYRSPVIPSSDLRLVLMSPRLRHETTVFPSNWRWLTPDELMALFR